MKAAIQICFCKVVGGNGKKLLPETFFKLSKKNLPYGCADGSADAKSAVLLKVPSITKVEVGNFPLLHFPRWLCLVHGQLDMSLRRVKRSVKCKYQCFCLFDIQKRSVLSSVLLSSPQKFPLRRDSAKCHLLSLYFQFSPKY